MLFAPGMVGLFIVVMVSGAALYGALIALQGAVMRGDESFTLGQAIGLGVRRLPRMLGASILFMLAVAGGFILLVIPGIYLMGKLQLWMPAMFLDDAGALESLRISSQLTRNRWWRATTILAVGFIIIYVFSLAFGIAGGVIAGVSHSSPMTRIVINQLFSAAANVVTLPLFLAIILTMYNDFKLRSEGSDLAARLGALGNA